MKPMTLGVITAATLMIAAATHAQDASQPPAATDAASARYLLRDARPDDDKKTKIMSVWMWSCDYAVTRIGDDAVVDDSIQDRIQLENRLGALERDLRRAFGAQLQGQEIVVDRYVVYVNGGAAETARSWGSGVAVVGAGGGAMEAGLGGGANAMIAGHPTTRRAKCPRERMKGGWFDASELTTSNSPFVAELTVRIGGKTYSARTVYSPADQASEALIISGLFLKINEVEAANAVVAKTNAALIAEITRRGDGVN